MEELLKNIDSSWHLFFQKESKYTYFKSLTHFLTQELNSHSVLPEKELIFRTFTLPISKIKVIILGQDPYPTKGHANGLCFSVNPGIYPLPKSLNNIYKELTKEFPLKLRMNGDLSDWLEQGVFLLNTILTLREGESLSHKNKGWEIFTQHVIAYIQENKSHCAYLLWGKNAHLFERIINKEDNLIIKTSHPSPLGYTKFGNDFIAFKNADQFSKTNEYLKNNNMTEIIW